MKKKIDLVGIDSQYDCDVGGLFQKHTQEISDDLELWCNGLKVKDVRKETIECMPS